MRRKAGLILGSFLFLVVGVVLVVLTSPPAFLYPALPFASGSKQAVLKMLRESDEGIVKLAAENDAVWYGAKSPQDQAAESMKAVMQAAGWTFVSQEGAGYFFVRGDEKMVVTSRMWSGEFVLFKVQVGVELGELFEQFEWFYIEAISRYCIISSLSKLIFLQMAKWGT